jgi:hypothetical protein
MPKPLQYESGGRDAVFLTALHDLHLPDGTSLSVWCERSGDSFVDLKRSHGVRVNLSIMRLDPDRTEGERRRQEVTNAGDSVIKIERYPASLLRSVV